METWPRLEEIHTLVFDFDGVFTDNKVYIRDDGSESVVCDRADGLAFDIFRAVCKEKNVMLDCFILSAEKNPVVEHRAKKLKLICHSGVKNKLQFIEEYFSQHKEQPNDPFGGLVYLGNDLNDLVLIDRAGFSVAPKDAHPLVKSLVSVVLPQNGGHGFVRAFIEKLLGIDNYTNEEITSIFQSND